MYFVMQVGPGTFSGASYPANYFAAFYLLPSFCLYPYHVGIQGFVAKAMIHYNMVAIAAGVKARFGNPSIGGGINGRAGCCSKIEPGMHFGYFINGVNTVTKPRSNPFQFLVAYGLYGRNGSQQVFFLFNEFGYFFKRFPLEIDAVMQPVEGLTC